MTKWAVDQAFQEFAKHKELIAAVSANEATTRLRAIDTVLFDILRWDKLSVESEKYCREQGYSDYAFLQGGNVCFVLEAKKQGTAFVLSHRAYDSAPFAFGLLATESPEAASAMAQAQRYAAHLGSRYIAISNGYQWLYTLTYVQGQPLDQRLLFVFESPGAIEQRFELFWRCFSQDGVYSNAASAHLLESRKAPAPPKLSASIPGYPVPAARNVLHNELDYVIELVWSKMEREETEEAFLRRCYVKPRATTQHLALFKELIELRSAIDSSDNPKVLGIESVPDLVMGHVSEKPIVIIGGVGHGKSTFLRYLRLIEARAVLSRYIQIDINFIDRPDREDDVGLFVFNEVERQLLERYGIDIMEDSFVRGALHLDLERFRRSPKGRLEEIDAGQYRREELAFISEKQRDRHGYLSQVFRHLRKGRNHSVAIFFDNLDRRIDAIQEEAFLLASAIGRDWSSLVFICLRPGTFYASISSGVLDSVAPQTVTVVSPPSELVLRRRLAYAAEAARGETDAGPAMGRGVSFNLLPGAAFMEHLRLAGKLIPGLPGGIACSIYSAPISNYMRGVPGMV